MAHIFTPFPLQSAHLVAVKWVIAVQQAETADGLAKAIVGSAPDEIRVCRSLWGIGENQARDVMLAAALAVDLARIPELKPRGARLSSRALLHALMGAGAISSVTDSYSIFKQLEQRSFFVADHEAASVHGIFLMGAGFFSLKDAIKGAGLGAAISLKDEQLPPRE